MTRKKHSVIFIGNQPDYDILSSSKSWKKNVFLQKYFLIRPKELPKRILNSFLPPIFSKGKPHKVHVDFVGPCLGLLLLNVLLHLGHAYKSPEAAVDMAPLRVLSVYSVLTPLFTYFLAILCQTSIKFSELLALFGYGLYGHVFTLGFSLFFYDEASNLFFLLCLILFSGLSTLRIALVLLTSIPKPIFRLLLCSVVSITQILVLIFFHFVYMHRTFVYAPNNAW